MSEIWDQLMLGMQGNQFLNGGLVLMVFGAAIALMRQLPEQLFSLARRQLTVEVECRDGVVVRWVDVYLRSHPYGRSCRRLKAVHEHTAHDGKRVLLVPGMGRHWLRQGKRWFLVTRDMEGGKEASGSNAPVDLSSVFRQEHVTISTWGRNPQPIWRLIEKARAMAYERSREQRGFTVHLHRWGNSWCDYGVGRLRPLESVVLADGLMQQLEGDLRTFLSTQRRDWYLQRGVPYRRGYLLEGPPGSGKSSVIKALCCELNLGLYMLDLTADIGDADVARLLVSLPERSAVLIEDVDCLDLSRQRDRDQPKGDREQVTLSGLLNALDGVVAAEGRVLFMTTNHPEQLDSALTRDGRVDMRLHLGWATAGQAQRLFLRFHPAEAQLSQRFAAGASASENTSMAKLQNLLIQHCERPHRAVEQLESRYPPKGNAPPTISRRSSSQRSKAGQ